MKPPPPAALLAALLVVLLFLCAALAAGGLWAWAQAPRGEAHGGEAPRRRGLDYTRSPHVVVDTLNLTHWLHGSGRTPLTLSPELIAETIDRTAPLLAARHTGRVMYVLKDRESQFNDEAAREVYRRAAERNGVYVLAAERYPDPPKGVAASGEHGARGRDDFYMGVLADRWRCAVVTADRLRDFGSFRATIQPFHVYEFAFWRVLPHREFIRPDAVAYRRLKKPRTIDPAAYFPAPAAATARKLKAGAL